MSDDIREEGRIAKCRNSVQVPVLNVCRISTDDSIWCGDSGAGDHMTCHRDWFEKYTELPPHKIEVVLGDNYTLDVHGVGSIRIRSEQKCYRLKRVLFVPNLHRNLLSLGEMTKKKFEIRLFGRGLKVYRGESGTELVMTGNLIAKGLYQMNFTVDIHVPANIVHSKDGGSLEVWHQRFGHTNFATIRKIVQSNSVNGIVCLDVNSPTSDCVPCLLGKMHRSTFKPSPTRKLSPAELIHFDIAGPFEVKSMGGASFMCLFVDDYTGMTFVRALKHKSEAHFSIKWMITVARKARYDVISFRSDNARKFFRGEMNRYLLEDFYIS